MPEATKYTCTYEELADASFTDADDGGLLLEGSAAVCVSPADHALVLRVEGRDELHTDYLCCTHRTWVIEELMSGGALGVELQADIVIGATLRCSVVGQPGEWMCLVSIVSVNGHSHTMPPLPLDAADYAAAEVEAHERVARIESVARGEDGTQL
jgi:hypothetical protein